MRLLASARLLFAALVVVLLLVACALPPHRPTAQDFASHLEFAEAYELILSDGVTLPDEYVDTFRSMLEGMGLERDTTAASVVRFRITQIKSERHSVSFKKYPMSPGPGHSLKVGHRFQTSIEVLAPRGERFIEYIGIGASPGAVRIKPHYIEKAYKRSVNRAYEKWTGHLVDLILKLFPSRSVVPALMKGGDFERRAIFEWLPTKERRHSIALEIARLDGVPSEVLVDALNELKGEDILGPKRKGKLRNWLIADSERVRSAASRLAERNISHSRHYVDVLEQIQLKPIKELLSDPDTRVGIAVARLREWNHKELQAFAEDESLAPVVRSVARKRLERSDDG